MEQTKNKKLTSSKKLFVLITIIKREKIDYYMDLIAGFDANMQLSTIGNGTTKDPIFKEKIGSKGVIFSVLNEDKAKSCLKKIEEKFSLLKNGKGVSFLVPIDSVMGVTLFNFLSNNKTKFD